MSTVSKRGDSKFYSNQELFFQTVFQTKYLNLVYLQLEIKLEYISLEENLSGGKILVPLTT